MLLMTPVCPNLRRRILVSVVLFVAAALTNTFAFADDVLWLTVLHHNDGESQLLVSSTGSDDFGGIARFKTLADSLKVSALAGSDDDDERAVILVSAGDNFLAGPEFTASLESGIPFFDAIGLDLIGYDALALGNHEFDFGPDVLEDFILSFSASSPPFLSANLDFTLEPGLQALVDTGRIAKRTVVRIGDDDDDDSDDDDSDDDDSDDDGESRRIGVVGATTPALAAISSPRGVQVDQDVAGAVQAEVDALTAAGVDIIVLVSHFQGLTQDLDLIPQLRGVDIAIAGGGDDLLANPGDLLVPGDEGDVVGPYPLLVADADGVNVPVATAPGNYNYIGRLVTGFDEDGELVAIDASSGPVRVSGVTPDGVAFDPQVQAQIVDPVQDFVDDLASNVIGTSQVGLDGRRPEIRIMETNLGNLVADSLVWQATQLAASFGVPAPDVGIANGGGIRNANIIGPGTITELDTFDVAAFVNFVSVVPAIPASQFKEILEHGVAAVEFAAGQWEQISGFSMTYDPNGTAQVVDGSGNVITPGTRIVDVVLDGGTVIVSNGSVVAGAPSVTIATIDFLARGGGQAPYRGAPFTTVGVTYQQALRDYVIVALGGLITSADYPVGGEGRITALP